VRVRVFDHIVDGWNIDLHGSCTGRLEPFVNVVVSSTFVKVIDGQFNVDHLVSIDDGSGKDSGCQETPAKKLIWHSSWAWRTGPHATRDEAAQFVQL
jgi:hypothetical protein